MSPPLYHNALIYVSRIRRIIPKIASPLHSQVFGVHASIWVLLRQSLAQFKRVENEL